MEEPILQIMEVKKYFKSGDKKVIKAIDNISLSINKGEIVGLVGESGCGKSTLGRAILKLHSVDEGEIWFKGKNITNLDNNEMRPIREKLQIVFQDPYASLNPRKRIRQIVEAPLNINGKYTKGEKNQKVIEILKEVGLSEKFLDKYPHEMSGGQRQRVVIARALINNPEVLICDEPVSALDVSVRSQVLNLLKKLKKERNLTYLFISHDLSVVEYLCDKIVVMYLGRVMEYADKKSLFKTPLHPYTRALISAIPVPDIHYKKEEIILEGEVPSPLNPPTGCLFSTRCPYATEKCREIAPTLQKIVEEDGTERYVACHTPVMKK